MAFIWNCPVNKLEKVMTLQGYSQKIVFFVYCVAFKICTLYVSYMVFCFIFAQFALKVI
jgi:hypothetical protein